MEYIGEIIAIGVDVVILTICMRQYNKRRKTINCVEQAPYYDITEDLRKVIEDAPGARMPYVVLRAAVKSLGNPIVSTQSPYLKGVIQRVTLSERVVTRASGGVWSEHSTPLHLVQRMVPFSLTGDNCTVEVVDALSAELFDMDVVWDSYEQSDLGILDYICGFFSGVRQQGIQCREEMLREGSVITAVGELCLTKDGALKLHSPKSGQPLFLTKLSKYGLIQRLSDGGNNLKTVCVFLGVAGVVLGGLLLRKYLAKQEMSRKNLRRREYLEKTRRERRVAARDQNLTEDQRCVVCVLNPKEIILLPCGHVCLCEDCASQISDNCPVCRELIELKAAAYVS